MLLCEQFSISNQFNILLFNFFLHFFIREYISHALSIFGNILITDVPHSSQFIIV